MYILLIYSFLKPNAPLRQNVPTLPDNDEGDYDWEHEMDDAHNQDMQVDPKAEVINVDELPDLQPFSRSPSVEILERLLSYTSPPTVPTQHPTHDPSDYLFSDPIVATKVEVNLCIQPLRDIGDLWNYNDPSPHASICANTSQAAFRGLVALLTYLHTPERLHHFALPNGVASCQTTVEVTSLTHVKREFRVYVFPPSSLFQQLT